MRKHDKHGVGKVAGVSAAALVLAYFLAPWLFILPIKGLWSIGAISVASVWDTSRTVVVPAFRLANRSEAYYRYLIFTAQFDPTGNVFSALLAEHPPW